MSEIEMRDVFYMPVKVFCSPEVVRLHSSDLKAFGRKALIVTGRHSALSCGAYDDIRDALDETGIEHSLFNEVEENPSVETVMKGRDIAVSQGADFVIGAGGGSAMDAAKAIALMGRHAAEGAEYLYSSGADSSCLPIVLVPTTCGTGSEVTAVSVLSLRKAQTKKSISHKIFADMALIDGKYLKGASAGIIHNTCFDALSHLYESYINSSATRISRMIADDGLRAWRQNLPVLRGERKADDKDRENLMVASMLAGMAIAHTGTSLPHGLSYALTYHLKVPHGKAVCFFMEGYLREADRADASHVLNMSGFASVDEFSKEYIDQCGQMAIGREELFPVLDAAIADLSSNSAKCAKAPFKADFATLRRIAYGSIK